MGRRKTSSKRSVPAKSAGAAGRHSALLDTRVIYCGDNLEQLAKLPDGCVDLSYIDPPESSNRNHEVFWGDKSEPRPSGSGFSISFEDRHACAVAYLDYMWPRSVQLAGVLKKTGNIRARTAGLRRLNTACVSARREHHAHSSK